MICKSCSAQIPDNAAVCPYCQTNYAPQAPQAPQGQCGFSNAAPSNFLPLAIFTTVCCCVPLGIVSIIKANKANELASKGDFAGAAAAASEAKMWAIIGIIGGFIVGIISFVINFAAGIASEL